MQNNVKPLRVAFFGPPGSGKGTQAKKFAESLGLPHISTGDILRNIQEDTANPLSQEVAAVMSRGEFVSAELVNRLVADRLKQDDCENGFILDGYPRTLGQAEFLDGIIELGLAILIDVSDAAIVDRMSGRRVCKNGHTYHIKYNPPKDLSVCDVCGEPLYLREDDNPETVLKRLEKYHQETDAILNRYNEKGILTKVDGEKNIDEVYDQIIEKIKVAGFSA